MISIVIPVYNRKELTRDCLISLRNQTVKVDQVIVVDDGSTDGTKEMLKNEFAEVFVICGSGNLFWTAAVNMGIRHALTSKGDYIMTMNNDTMASGNFIENMLGWAVKKPDAILSSFELDIFTKNPYYGGEVVNWFWDSSRFLLDVLHEEDHHGLHEISVASGRGLLIPRKVFETVGLFAEKELPHYMADYDFACLARRSGFELYCNYDAKLFTYSDESGDKKIIRKKSLKNYFNHLFSIKGGGNLKNFTIYTFRNSPKVLIPLHLVKGYSQRILGYLLK